jgi:transcription elongation factor Elf1
LYRGDKKGNKTLPEKYRTDGLLTKQINSNESPVAFRKYGWLRTLKSHIDPIGIQESFIYNTSQFLSLSSERYVAEKYLATTRNLKFNPAAADNPKVSGYIFIATFEKEKIKKIGNGMYLYKYKCNYEKSRISATFQTLSSLYVSCAICGRSATVEHNLILIDAKTYLSNFKNKYPEAYRLADQDLEWLIIPLDQMVNTPVEAYYSRVAVADFWTTETYIYM